jgi:DNA polymerase III alpha subunit (gram-positive type)
MIDKLLRYNEEKEFVFVDCETFNLCLNPCHNLPWQIAMLKVKGDKILESKDFYIKWDTHLEIGKEAARITNYDSSKMRKKGLPPEEVFPTIEDWLDNCDYILGHNVLGFDIYLIKGYYEFMKKSYMHLTHKVIDTMCLSRGLKLNIPYKSSDDLTEYQYRMTEIRKKGVRTSLKAMGKHFGIEQDYDNLHDALVDLKLNLKIWNKIKWQVEI